MSALKPKIDLAVGDTITGPTRPLTTTRVGWYSVGLLSAAAGRLMPIQFNIHTDDEYARSQGLPAAIADGMHSTNWLSTMLSEHFGEHYLVRGALRTKFIKPTYVNVPITTKGVVTAKTDSADGGTVYQLDVWCEDDKGEKLTVGDASATVVD
ncbi:MAG TPA: MaoC family dehydratase [Galbitalea sp.]|nr:MaoC family dehydratase [Galbitalea sp.]